MPTVAVNRLPIDVPDTAGLLTTSALGAGSLLLTEYSATFGGVYVQINSTPLVAKTSTYVVYDIAGVTTGWYRTRLSNAGGTTFSNYSDPFQAPTPTLLYCSLSDFRSRLAGDVPNMSGNFDYTVLGHIADVSDGINSEVQTQRGQPEGWSFLPGTPAQRRFTGYPGGTDMIVIDDAVSIESVTILNPGGTVLDTLTAGTDYLTYPLNSLPIEALKAVSSGKYPTWPEWYGGIRIGMTPGYAMVTPSDIHDVALTESIRAYMSARAGENDQVGVGPLGTIVTSKAFTDKSRRILNRYAQRMGWFRS